MKFLERNPEETLQGTEISKDLFGQFSKNTGNKTKVGKWDYIKPKLLHSK